VPVISQNLVTYSLHVSVDMATFR